MYTLPRMRRVQLQKAFAPIICTDSGIESSTNPLQFLNEDFPIEANPSGKSTFVISVQSQSASSAIPNVPSCTFKTPLNVVSTLTKTLFRYETSFEKSDVPLNASFLISIFLLDNLISFRFLHPSNADSLLKASL